MTWVERALWSAGLVALILIALRQRSVIKRLARGKRAAEGRAFEYRAKLYGTTPYPRRPTGFIRIDTPRNDT